MSISTALFQCPCNCIANMSKEDSEKPMASVKNMVTLDEVVGIAKKITNDKSVRVLDYSLNDYSNEKLGFTASHHILKIQVLRSQMDSQETITAFVKIASLPKPDGFDPSIDINAMIAYKETFFLETLVAQFADCYKGERWCPMHYFTTRNIVVMEDLKTSGYKLIEKLYDDYNVLKSVLVSLARFHSCSILAEARMSRESQCSIGLNERYKDNFSEMIFIRNGEKASWFTSVTKLTCALAEHFGHEPETVRKLFYRACDMVQPSPTHRNVVCHGDVHSKNLMFVAGSHQPKCILIDFQTYRYAPLVTDILQFLHINASRKFREQHEADLVEFYHSALTDSIRNSDSTKTIEIPTLEDINKGMEELRAFGLVIACIYYPFLFLDPELMKKHARDSEFNDNLVFGDRMDLTFSHMQVNESYKNMIKDVIRELLERSEA